MLEIKNICFEAMENNEKKVILNNISFSCADNELLVITGHNGSGKSTLLKIIMGILKPTSGQIIFDGKDITNLEISERAKLKIAYSFQTPVCFKGITVKDLLSIASGEEKNKIENYCDILSALGICAREYLDREVNGKLSGGEQKRIDLASVLIRKAKLNLFDEPEAGIDIWSFDKLVDLFKNINGSSIIVSHQKKLIEKADKILVLDNANVAAYGEAKDILPTLNKENFCKKLRREDGQN